jgi:hypothetical protein
LARWIKKGKEDAIFFKTKDGIFSSDSGTA